MRSLLSRHRYQLVALAFACLVSGVHLLAGAIPVRGIATEALEGEPGPGTPEKSVTRLLAEGLHTFEGRVDDAQMRLRGDRPPHPDVVIAAIDEKSLTGLGRYPWDRRVVAKGLVGLHAAGARAIGVDIAFTNAAPDPAGEALHEARAALQEVQAALPADAQMALEPLREVLGGEGEGADARLAATLRDHPQVVLGVIAYPRSAREGVAPMDPEERARFASQLLQPPFAGRVEGSVYEVALDQVPSFRQLSAQPPLAILAEAGNPVGMLNVSPDPDGVIRRLPLFARLEEPPGLLPSLVLQTVAAAEGTTPAVEWNHHTSTLSGARLRGADGRVLRVPLAEDEPYTLIDYPGRGERVFPQVSFVDAVEGRLPPGSLEGKIVLVGVTYDGGFDQRVSPFSEYEPGVFIHASLLSNVLEQSFLRRPVSLRLWEILFIIGVALGLSYVLPRVRFSAKVALFAAPPIFWLALDQWMLGRGLALASVLPFVGTTGSAASILFVAYLTADREKGRLRHAFEHYVNPSVMREMLAHPHLLKLGGDKRELTVLFSDIRGFTTLAERLTPEALVKFINAYLTPMTHVVLEQGGTLDKYIGDAVMAFWGAPVQQEDHALRACRAAVGMREELERLRKAWREQNLPEVDMGVGINTGPMIVGNMGSEVRFDYTVMGDAVNLASRLEGMNKTYRTHILMSEATFLAVEGQVTARRLGAVRVKGKRKPVRIYELLAMGAPDAATSSHVKAFEAGVDAFGAQRFDEARAQFEQVLEQAPEDAAAMRYLESSLSLLNAPPGADWDGVETATTK
ncbi:MAG TPA: adenylate/guanylate cyclase domain-containing protein [Myxococcaceae bacterium]|nr:adenylate/guanylate cyclase domain-containing protein [Myxococcaceae bacterium]